MGWFTRIPEYKITRMELIARIGWPTRMEFIARIGWPRRRKCTRVLVCLRDNRWSLVLVRVGYLLIGFCCSPEFPCLPEYFTATRISSIPRIPEYFLFPEYPNGQMNIVARIQKVTRIPEYTCPSFYPTDFHQPAKAGVCKLLSRMDTVVENASV